MWTQQTFNQINQHIIVGLNIDTNFSNGRVILLRNLDNDNKLISFTVRIGTKRNIIVPITMLRDCYNAAYNNSRIYNTNIFKNQYEDQYDTHDCYVGVVGMIFWKARLVKQITLIKNSLDFRLK